MKQFIKTFIVFLFFSIIYYLILLFVIGDVAPGFLKKNLNYKIGSYGHMFSRISEVKSVENIDILFIGSSHAYRGFDTRLFKKNNYKVFNLGSSSQSPLQEELLLNQYIAKLNPKLVVFEMYPMVFEGDGVESGLDILANNQIDINSIKMCLKINSMKLYNTLLYAYYNQIRETPKKFMESIVKDEDTYVNGGFVERKVSSYHSPKIQMRIKKHQINPVQSKTFEKILIKLKEHKTNYILVQAPITRSLYNSFSTNDQIDSLYSSWGSYYNFNHILNLNDSLFYDSNHLNQNGVEIFNQSFIELLKKDNLLKNQYR